MRTSLFSTIFTIGLAFSIAINLSCTPKTERNDPVTTDLVDPVAEHLQDHSTPTASGGDLIFFLTPDKTPQLSEVGEAKLDESTSSGDQAVFVLMAEDGRSNALLLVPLDQLEIKSSQELGLAAPRFPSPSFPQIKRREFSLFFPKSLQTDSPPTNPISTQGRVRQTTGTLIKIPDGEVTQVRKVSLSRDYSLPPMAFRTLQGSPSLQLKGDLTAFAKKLDAPSSRADDALGAIEEIKPKIAANHKKITEASGEASVVMRRLLTGKDHLRSGLTTVDQLQSALEKLRQANQDLLSDPLVVALRENKLDSFDHIADAVDKIEKMLQSTAWSNQMNFATEFTRINKQLYDADQVLSQNPLWTDLIGANLVNQGIAMNLAISNPRLLLASVTKGLKAIASSSTEYESLLVKINRAYNKIDQDMKNLNKSIGQ